MALSYLFDPNKQFQDKNGVNNVGGYLYVFINDSDDHAPTYCNFTGTLNPERIVLDNNGRAVVIVDELKTYRIEVYDRSGNLLWSQYPVRPTNVIYGGYNVYNADINGTPDEIDVDVETSASGVKKFTIKLANVVKTVIGNIQDTISSIVESVSTKADKVQGATAGNLAALDANGNLTDSGKKASDFKTKQTAVPDLTADGTGLSFIDSVTQNANGEITPHKKTVQDGTTAQKGVVRLSNAIDSTSTTEAATPKAVKDAYDALNNKIVARAVFLSQAEWTVQSQIPGDPAKVYYVENGTGEDAYTVYVWKESTSEYVEVDESSIDLDGYWHDSPTTTGNGNVVTNITLGNDGVPVLEKGITALTQHQSVTDNNPTLSWSSTSTVGTVGSTNLRVTMPSNPASGKADKANITGATKCKITYNSQGIVTAGADLSASDIPNLAASKITSGTFGTSFIADDAITADKVKDNETLPVNVRGTAAHLSAYGEWNTWNDTYVESTPFALIGEQTWPLTSNNGDGSVLQFERNNDLMVRLKLYIVTSGSYIARVEAILLEGTINIEDVKGNIKITYFTYTSNNTQYITVRLYVMFTGNWQNWRVRQLDCQTADNGYLNWRPFKFFSGRGTDQSSAVGTPATYSFRSPFAYRQVGDSATPVYVDSNGKVQQCSTSDMSVRNACYVRPFIIDKNEQTTKVWAKVATASVSAWYGYSITFQAGFSGYGGTVDYVAEISVGYKTVGGGAYGDYTLFIYRRNYSSTAILDAKLVRNGNTLELWVKDGITDTALFLVPVYHQGFLPNYADSNDRSKQLSDAAFTTYIADKTKYDAVVRTTAYIPGFSQVGSTSNPVYVDSNGQVQPCDLAQLKAALAAV